MPVRVSNLVFISCEIMGVLLLRHVGFSHRRRSRVTAATGDGCQGYRQTGSEAIAVSFSYYRISNQAYMYRVRLFLLFGKQAGASVVADLALSEKSSVDTLGLWFCDFEVGAFSENYILYIGIITYGY
ncbi:uncharacterized protein LOC110269717 [Arachis ipaensis]|uniref:uncharacterized protein LOC110269717 n=1 Tax=Arachis ipaensis TaxID=130454 RepID=UPI000A2B636A|nr:uncharacterized protein LOC110269717 [Arachis ipaensis]